MSQKIEFSCPSCHTSLRVPAEMAGVNGPCPTCHNTIAAPHPQPVVKQPMATPTLITTPPLQQKSAPQQKAPAPQTSPAIAPVQQGFNRTRPNSQPTQSYQSAQSPLQPGVIPASRPLGATPHQQHIESSVNPRAFNASCDSGLGRENDDVAPTLVRTKRRIWPAFVFPLLFIGLSVAVIYLILDMMKVFEPVVQPEPELTPNESLISETLSTPPARVPVEAPEITLPPPVTDPSVGPTLPTEVTPDSPEIPKELEHDKRDVNTPDEVPSELPLAAKKKEKVDTELGALPQAGVENTRFIVASEGILRQFLSAKTFEERLPFMTKSRRSPEELRSSALAGPLPRVIISRPETSFPPPSGHVMDSYHSVAFDMPSEERKSRIITLRLVSYAEDEPPRVQTDVFLDLYDGNTGKFAEKPVEGLLTVHAIVKVSSFCFVDGIPDPASKATVSLFQNVTAASNIIAKAFIRAESDIFKKLRGLISGDSHAAVSLTLEWNTTEDPTKPYLEIVRLNALNWSIN